MSPEREVVMRLEGPEARYSRSSGGTLAQEWLCEENGGKGNLETDYSLMSC